MRSHEKQATGPSYQKEIFCQKAKGTFPIPQGGRKEGMSLSSSTNPIIVDSFRILISFLYRKLFFADLLSGAPVQRVPRSRSASPGIAGSPLKR
jgi:hypothetical protein